MTIVVIVDNDELPLQSSMCPSFFCLAQALHCHYSSRSSICRLFTPKGSELTSLSALTRQGLCPIFVQLRTTLLLVVLRPAPATIAPRSLVHLFDLRNQNLKMVYHQFTFKTTAFQMVHATQLDSLLKSFWLPCSPSYFALTASSLASPPVLRDELPVTLLASGSSDPQTWNW